MVLYAPVSNAQTAEKINSVTFSGMSLFKTVGNKWAVADSMSNKPLQYIIETHRDKKTIHLMIEQTKDSAIIDMAAKTIIIPTYDSSEVKHIALKLSGWGEPVICNGWTVNEVKTNVGFLYKLADNKWIETDLKGTSIGHFTETNRDNWSVYLLKDDGNELRIDVLLKTTFFTNKGQKPFELYKLTSCVNEIRISGFTVNLIKTAKQSFFRTNDSTWVSIDSAEKFNGFFYEQRRDDSSVLLASTNTLKVFIDIKNKKITYTQPNLNNEMVEFSLTDWSNEIPGNGFTLNQVTADKKIFFTAPAPGKWVLDDKVYKYIDKSWIETDSTKKPIAYFSEMSRSNNSIVLKKEDGLILRISIPDKIIYVQTAPNKEQSQFVITSLSRAEFVNGYTVKKAIFSNGAFLQKEGKKWVEINADNKETASFTEVNRDEWSVYLLKEDGSDLRIDLYLKTTFYNPKGEKPFELYRLTSFTN